MFQKAIKNPRKALDALRYGIFKTVGHQDFKRFIVLSRSRTGSNLLISFLNSHPNIYAQGEIFRELGGRDYKDVLGTIFSRQPHYIKAAGFKIFYYHPQDCENCGLWRDLEDMQDLYVIHLKRRNILRTLISRKIAGNRDEWLTNLPTKTDSKKDKSVEFSVEELEEGFKQTRVWEEDGDRRFSHHPSVSIYYEDLIGNPESGFEKITDLLGFPYVRPKTGLRRQNPEKTRDLVVNYERLKPAFDGTMWQMFFED